MKNQYTPPVFVVSLAGASERKQLVKDALSSIDVECRFFPAVDGRQMGQAELEKVYSRELALKWKGRELSQAEVGTCLSHFAVWEKMVEDNLPSAFIFEDDAHAGRMFKEFMGKLDCLPEDWEIIIFKTDASVTHDLKPLFDIYSIGKFDRWPNLTMAYLLSLNAAKKMLNVAKPIRVPLDHYTSRDDIVKLNRYGVVPDLVTGFSVSSTIGNREDGMKYSWQKKLKNKAVRATKKILRIIKHLSGDRSID